MTTWVLLRGLTREAGHWGSFSTRLADRLGPGDRLLALDLPGAGTAHAMTSPCSVPALVADCRARLAAQALPPPYRLVALSLGGMVAIEWARAAPAELDGCALINTSVRGFAPFWLRLRPRNLGAVLRLLLPGRDALAREREVLHLTSADPQAHPLAPAQWAAIASARPVTARNALRQLLAAARYAAPARPPAVPLLILASAGDTLVAPECSRRLARGWRLPCVLHPHAGHDLPLDDPDWLLGELSTWASSLAWGAVPGP